MFDSYEILADAFQRARDSFRTARQREKMVSITIGCSYPQKTIDRMEAKGWDIIRRYEYDAGPLIAYDAVKGSHGKGGVQWYRDLREVLGFGWDAISDAESRDSLNKIHNLPAPVAG